MQCGGRQLQLDLFYFQRTCKQLHPFVVSSETIQDAIVYVMDSHATVPQPFVRMLT